MRVLVTGGAGRLGQRVCRKFVDEGFQIRVLDLDTPRNRKSVREMGDGVEAVWGDITSPDSVRKAMGGIGAVVHMAGILPPISEQKPELATRVNVGGTRVLVNLLRERQLGLPFVFTSSVAVFGSTLDASRPVSVELNTPRPEDTYARTKLEIEELIKQSGVEYVILRLSAAMYPDFGVNEIRNRKTMYTIPLNNRVETCHCEDAALAIVNAVSKFDEVKRNTLVISGGPSNRMLYGEMVAKMLDVIGLPVPRADRFTTQPYCLDWYDTSKSQELLRFQNRGFSDYLDDYRSELSRKFSPLFLPFMSHCVGPLFGRIIVRLM